MISGTTTPSVPEEQDPRIANLIFAAMQQMTLDKEVYDCEHPEHSREMDSSNLWLLARRKVLRDLSDPSKNHKP